MCPAVRIPVSPEAYPLYGRGVLHAVSILWDPDNPDVRRLGMGRFRKHALSKFREFTTSRAPWSPDEKHLILTCAGYEALYEYRGVWFSNLAILRPWGFLALGKCLSTSKT